MSIPVAPQSMTPVARAKSALALLTVIVSALKSQWPQYAFEGLLVTAAILSAASTGAGQFRSHMIAGISIEPLFQSARCQA
jgi:hypothetical protein